jgi:prephenate dehydrogenase
MVRENDTPDQLMKTLAAGGFKDITRIASSSADVWSQICHTNKEQISNVLSIYIDILTEVKKHIDSDNKEAIYNMFSESKEYRDSISIKNKGPISNNYVMYCDIEDKEGALSKITVLLSDNHINIKNIEIIHNREYKQGVLLIAFYDEKTYQSAYSLLSDNGYFIHN